MIHAPAILAELEAGCARDLRWYLACQHLAEHCAANRAERRRKASERSARGWATRRAA